MTCITNNCRQATQVPPDCGNLGIYTFPDCGLALASVTLRIEKPNGALLDLELTTNGDGTLDFVPDNDLPAGNEDLINSEAGGIKFSILDGTETPQTMTDSNGLTADCVVVKFARGDGTWAGTAVFTFE